MFKFQKSLQFIALQLALITTLVIIPSVAYSQSSGWSEPVPVSPTNPSGWFPDIAVDGTGRIHVVWASGVEGATKDYHSVMYRTSLDGKTWSETVDIAIPELSQGEATRPTLYADAKNTLHLTYRGTNVYYSHATEDPASAKSWLAPRKINADQVAYFSDLASDNQGTLHLIFTQNVSTESCLICYHVFYRNSKNNGLSWSDLVEISKIPLGAAKPQLLIDHNQNLHVVWEAGIGGSYGSLAEGDSQVMYSASYNGGQTWTPATEFVAPGGDAKNIAIGLDREGKLIVVWRGSPDDLIYYEVSADQGRSWSPPHSIPGVVGAGTSLDSYSMATDSAGNIHLVFVGDIVDEMIGTTNVLHAIWDGTAWSSPEAIAIYAGDLPEWPRIVVNNGNNLHVVWFVRDKEHIFDSDNQEYQIWYAHGQSQSPEVIPPTPQPTQTPTPAPVPPAPIVPTPTPTIPPILTLAPDIANVSIPSGTLDSMYTENDELLLLLQSLVPATIMLVLVLGGVWLWRR